MLTTNFLADPVIRFCGYNIKRAGGEVDEADLLALNEDGDAGVLLRSKLDVAIEATLMKQAETMEQVTWRGLTVPVRNDKVCGQCQRVLHCG